MRADSAAHVSQLVGSRSVASRCRSRSPPRLAHLGEHQRLLDDRAGRPGLRAPRGSSRGERRLVVALAERRLALERARVHRSRRRSAPRAPGRRGRRARARRAVACPLVRRDLRRVAVPGQRSPPRSGERRRAGRRAPSPSRSTSRTRTRWTRPPRPPGDARLLARGARVCACTPSTRIAADEAERGAGRRSSRARRPSRRSRSARHERGSRACPLRSHQNSKVPAPVPVSGFSHIASSDESQYW